MHQVLYVVLIVIPSRKIRMSTITRTIHTHHISLIAAMSSNTRTLGQAPSTSGADAAALKLFNVYRGMKEKLLFSDMLFSEIVSDTDLDKFGKRVEKRCMSQIHLYEGGSP